VFILKVPWRQSVTAGTPLVTLAQQISQQQAELEALRREYELRQTNLAELNRRKEELRGQLRQIEAEIQATRQGGPVSSTVAGVPASKGRPGRPKGRRGRPKGFRTGHAGPRPNTLPALLLELVQGASGPITASDLAQQVVRRKFPTTSKNLVAMVETRLHDLVRKGLLARASGQPGFVATGSASKQTQAKAPAGRHGSQNGAASGEKQPPLRVVLANLLAKSKKPLTARELAEQALAGGYQTSSKNFTNVMGVALGQMDNIRNIPGRGYILKK
jgi:hypothetical protein